MEKFKEKIPKKTWDENLNSFFEVVNNFLLNLYKFTDTVKEITFGVVRSVMKHKFMIEKYKKSFEWESKSLFSSVTPAVHHSFFRYYVFDDDEIYRNYFDEPGFVCNVFEEYSQKVLFSFFDLVYMYHLI
jgi:predicted AlkP superfamily phosphohydrolase/phosphomutase